MHRLAAVSKQNCPHSNPNRHNHIAAAIARLPEVRAPAANRRGRVGAVLRLLARGLEAAAPRLDAHQLAATLASFGRLRLAPPAALHAVCSLLAADGGAALRRELHPWELAAAARALAALQDEAAQAAAEAADAAAEGLGPDLTHSSAAVTVGGGGHPALGAGGAGGQPLLGAGDALSASASGAGGGGGALALPAPVESLWALIPEAARARLGSFPAADLAALAWALARSGRADQRFMTDVSREALSRPGKFDAEGVAALTSALAAAGHVDVLLLGALSREVAGRKAEFTIPQLAGGRGAWCLYHAVAFAWLVSRIIVHAVTAT